MLHPSDNRHKRGRALGWTISFYLLLAAILLVPTAMFWPRGPLASRDLGCANMEPKRAREICRALSETLAWTWLGHAVIAPGWRVTWNGLRRVYCGEQVSEADVPALEAMARASDWRLQSGAENLLRLLRAAEGAVDEPETSIFNPLHSEYLLKNGCVGR